MTIFAKRVKNLMGEMNLTQKKLSELSGVSEPSLCRYLNNKEPRFDVVMNIAKALGVSTNYLLGKEEDKENNDFEQVRLIVARNSKVFTEEQRAELISLLFKNK